MRVNNKTAVNRHRTSDLSQTTPADAKPRYPFCPPVTRATRRRHSRLLERNVNSGLRSRTTAERAHTRSRKHDACTACTPGPAATAVGTASDFAEPARPLPLAFGRNPDLRLGLDDIWNTVWTGRKFYILHREGQLGRSRGNRRCIWGQLFQWMGDLFG